MESLTAHYRSLRRKALAPAASASAAGAVPVVDYPAASDYRERLEIAEAALATEQHARKQVHAELAKTEAARADYRARLMTAERRIVELDDALERERTANAAFISLREAHLKDGRFDVSLKVAEEIICGMTDALQVLLKDAQNYAECDLHNRAGDRFIVRIQRASGKTPHDLRREAEAKIAAMTWRRLGGKWVPVVEAAEALGRP